MSWLSDRTGIHVNSINDITSGRAIKETGHAIGQAASNPWVQGGLGLVTGGLAAPIIAGAAGGLLKPGGNPGEAVKGGLQGAAAGGAGKAVGGALGIGGAAGTAGGAAGGAGGAGASAGASAGAGGFLDYLKAHAGDVVGAIGSFVKDHPGQALDLGLGAAGMINAAQLQGKSSDFANKAYDTVQQSYGERAPLRAAGIEGMLRPVPSSDVQQIGLGARATNPFATKGPLPFQKALTPTAVPGAVPPVPQNPNPTAGVGFNGFPEGLALSGVGRTAQRV